jgi:alkylation response protein AidB-like acyl-CoA dehydrogenase
MENVFVPDERITDLGACTDGAQECTFPGHTLWRSAFAPLMVSILSYPVLGLGMHMLEEFLRGLPKRDIKLTPYNKQGEAPVTHIQVGMASAKIDAANLLMSKAAADIDEWSGKREYMPMMERARIVRDTSVADQMVWEAVDLLSQASGGAFTRRESVLNRIWQETKVATAHPFVTLTSNYESYGRLLCGVTPPLMPV